MKKKYDIEDRKIVISLRVNPSQLETIDYRCQLLNKDLCTNLNRSEYILYSLDLLLLNKFDYSVANITMRREAARRKKYKKLNNNIDI